MQEQWLLCLYEITGDGVGCGGEDASDSGAEVARAQQERRRQVSIALVAADLEAGRLVFDVFSDRGPRAELDARLRQLAPSELLLPHSASAGEAEAEGTKASQGPSTRLSQSFGGGERVKGVLTGAVPCL